jgi:hypothetical protein
MSPKLSGQLQKVFNGSIVQAELNAQGETELGHYLEASQRQATPKTRRQVGGLSHSGVLQVKDANRQIDVRKEEDVLSAPGSGPGLFRPTEAT